MQQFFLALMLAAYALLPAPAQAVELDASTELLLRCGSGYAFLAAAPGATSSEQEAATMRSLAQNLMGRADDNLAAMGVSVEEREKIGVLIGTEVATALINDTDPGFEIKQCVDQVLADDPEAAAAANARTEEVQQLLICGALFNLVAETAKANEEADKTTEFEARSKRLLTRADDLMTESGMDEASRTVARQRFGEQVLADIEQGKDHDWDTCARIEG